jgi:cobalt-zinc-cadmium efflux system membrane fusion protein
MKRNTVILVVIVAVASALTTLLLTGTLAPPEPAGQVPHHEAEDIIERGPNGGRMLRDGDFAVEVVIAEAGVPPEFHVYAFLHDAMVPAGEFTVTIELGRLGGIRDTFGFIPEGDYLRGLGVVRHEGRTTINARIAAEAGIETGPAGAQNIVEAVELTGNVQADPGRVSEVRARFPGIVTEVRRDTGDVVSRGEVLGLVETNESLRSIAIEAPISGRIVNRNIQVGQVTGSQPLFVIADLDEVWVQLDVFGRDLGRIAAGQAVTIRSLDGTVHEGTIDWVSPLVAHGSQSVRARVRLPNPDGALRAGQFVRARVVVEETQVPLAVRRSALQTFRDFDVVYARVGDVYEVRMLELGRSDDVHIEVLGGLSEGEIYVTANSYLVKADIEKSGASHDH